MNTKKNMTQINIVEIKRLYEMGFAVHWLKPKSKVPLNPGWTTREKESWGDLKKSYRPSLNVGVRLGSVSKLPEGYLAVIDVDVKSDDPKHQSEAMESLLELYPDIEKAPKVLSGRGNGSCHFYVVTETPISGGAVKAQSSDMVKVHMPSSKKPSKREILELSIDEISEGIRLRHAWEISVLSEGRQVVLPGSIHPDTGNFYTWEKSPAFHKAKFIKISSEPDTSAALKRHLTVGTAKSYDFTEVDLSDLNLKPEMELGIREGDGVEDRSAFAFSVCMALVNRNVEDDVILSVLTDQNFYLGQVGFDHAKTTNRDRAAFWVEKYCLTKAKEKVHESKFGPAIEIMDVETSDDLPEWVKNLEYTSGAKGATPKIKSNFSNVHSIIINDVSKFLLQRNLFTHDDIWTDDTPWGIKKGRQRSTNFEDAIRIKKWLIEKWEVDAPTNVIEEVLIAIAISNSYHPVRDFLESLEWDGEDRVANAFKTYLGAAAPEPYLSDISRKFFLALIRRIYEPGCKFDHVPVFEGVQGIGKSTFGRILVGQEWFLDNLPNLSDKDSALYLQGTWLCEMGELSSLYRSQLEAAKAFITREVDKVRPPYGRRRIDVPRQCVFLGTTNSQDYLQDATGNRRFWPVEVHQCDFEALQRDRLQLLAEAKFLYDFANEPLWLEGKSKVQSVDIQSTRKLEDEGDSMSVHFAKWLEDSETDNTIQTDDFRMGDMFSEGPFRFYPDTRTNRVHAARVLRAFGFERKHSKQGKIWSYKG